MNLDVGTVIDGKYRIDGLLGRGGMGVVYRARQLNLDRPVAVKVLPVGSSVRSALLDRFRREALAVARLRHPNIVTVHDFGDSAEVGAYIVLELLDGRSLGDEIARRKRLAVAPSVAIAVQVCAALGAAHGAGVVHRDLKPTNIFLEQRADGVTTKVLDFGIAKLRDEDGVTVDRVTLPGTILGTPIYMSPEQCDGGQLDDRSDIYSLGCVLYEMLTGRPPFEATSFHVVMRKHMSETPQPPSARAPEIPPELDAAVLRALAKRRDERFASATDFVRALVACGAVSDGTAATESFGVPTLAMRLATDEPDVSGRTYEERTAIETREVPPNNLRREVTTFVGRSRELSELWPLAISSRLLTLVGPGGVGKTRLALELAHAALDRGSAVWWTDLAATTDPSLIGNAVGASMGLRDEPGRPMADVLVSALREERTVVVLDGCEHLIDAAAALASRLATGCPDLRVLATGREALGVAGEVVWLVPPLGLPDDATAAAASDAVALFVDRVRLRDREFVVDERNAAVVAGICRRVDGIPLAVELAASRARVLTLDQIHERLGDRFRLLAGGARTALPRHRTLWATIDWSYELLAAEDRRLFERLSVFVGGFTLEAAESVAEPEDALEQVGRLVDKSLLVADVRSGEARYRMLDTIREFAGARLRESGDERLRLDRHTAWSLAFAVESQTHIDGPEQTAWAERLRADHENLRAAIARASEAGDWRTCAEMGWALLQYWILRGHWTEAYILMRAVVESGAELSDESRARALHALGHIENYRVEYAAAERHLDEALEIRRRLNDRTAIASTLRMLGTVLTRLREFERGEALLDEALAIYRDLGDEPRVGWVLGGLGTAAMDTGDYDRARAWMEECLAIFRRTGGTRQAASALHNLGVIAWSTGDLDGAERLLDESVDAAIAVGDRQLTSLAELMLGRVAAKRGDAAKATSLFDRALATSRALGDALGTVGALEGLALLVARGEPSRAVALLDEASALREAYGLVAAPVDRAALDACRAAASRREET